MLGVQGYFSIIGSFFHRRTMDLRWQNSCYEGHRRSGSCSNCNEILIFFSFPFMLYVLCFNQFMQRAYVIEVLNHVEINMLQENNFLHSIILFLTLLHMTNHFIRNIACINHTALIHKTFYSNTAVVFNSSVSVREIILLDLSKGNHWNHIPIIHLKIIKKLLEI